MALSDTRSDLEPAQDSEPFRLDPRYRTFGAVVGAGLASVVMAGLYAVTAIPALDSVLLVRTIFDPGGLESAGGPPIVWAVAPVAGALAGWLVAPRALAGDRWSGSAMGILTYAVAVLIGPLAVFGANSANGGGGDPGPIMQFVGLVAGSLFFAVIGAVVLLPLSVVCIGGGTLWAVVFRGMVEASGGLGAALPSKPFQARAFVVLFAIGLVAWMMVAVPLLGLFSDGGAFVD